MESKEFKVGDRVKYTSVGSKHLIGDEGVVLDTDVDLADPMVYVRWKKDKTDFWVFQKNISRIYETLPELIAATDATTKDTNPKDLIGSTKLGMNLVPDTLMVYAALAFTEGATKYGAFNWRVAGVRASIYKAAHDRHMAKYWNGEWADPITGVPHLSSAIACLAIILDANVAGKLTDDRPPAIPLSGIIDGLEPIVKQLMELHKDKKPHHHTEADKA